MEVNNQASGSTTPAAPSDVGQSGSPTPPTRGKRKAPHEYSTNPNTVRVRERNAKLNPYKRAVERARSNDMKAVSMAWKQRTTMESFQEASESEKQRIIENVEKEIMDRRRRKKIDYASKVAALNELLGVGEDLPAPRSGRVNNNAARSMPAMAPPGYNPFPTQPIPHLMEMPKSAPSLAALNPAPVSTTARAEDNAARSTSGPRTMGTTTVQGVVQSVPATVSIPVEYLDRISAALQDIKEGYEADKRDREEENKRLRAELRELQDAMENTRDQMQHAIDTLRSSQHAGTQPSNGAPVPTHSLSSTQGHTHQSESRYEFRYTSEGTDDYSDYSDYSVNSPSEAKGW